MRLHRAARHDRLAPRADHDRRRAILARLLALDDPVERGLVGHCDDRLDRALVQVLPQRQLVVHCLQDIAGAGDRVFRPLDHHLVAARGDEHRQAVFHLHQIRIELAEQGHQQRLVLELHIHLGAAMFTLRVRWGGEARLSGAGWSAAHASPWQKGGCES